MVLFLFFPGACLCVYTIDIIKILPCFKTDSQKRRPKGVITTGEGVCRWMKKVKGNIVNNVVVSDMICIFDR